MNHCVPRTASIMRTRVIGVMALVAALFLGPATASAILVTFEEGVGNDQGVINTQYTGITFQSATTGQPWQYADATSNNWQVSSWPTKQQWSGGYYWINDLVGAFTTTSGDNGRVAFDNQDASFVQINYSCNDTFYLEAYDAGGTLIDTDSGAANLRYNNGNESGPGTLRVDAPAGQSIAYVDVHDTGNYWVVDNMSTDATGIIGPGGAIPEPMTMLAVGLSITGVAGYIRKRRTA